MKLTFLKGIRDGLPICLGYLSVSFAFGIFAVSSGLTVWQTLLISLVNVTSAGQLAAVPIMVSCGGIIQMISTQFVINMRYALMSVSLSQKLDGSMTLPHRLAVSFMNTDEVFAVASAQIGNVGKEYMYGLILTPYLGWAAGTLFGAAAGDILPVMITACLSLAIYGMFTAIIIPAVRVSKPTLCCVAIAVVLSCVFYFTPVLKTVPAGFVIIICAVIASAVMAAVCPVKKEAEEDE